MNIAEESARYEVLTASYLLHGLVNIPREVYTNG
jgi:hypothetical protein